MAVDSALKPVETVAIECYGSVGMQCLVHQIHAAHALPELVGTALERNFLVQSIDALLLFERENIHKGKVLVEEHSVVEILITSDGIHYKLRSLIFKVKTCIEHSAAITAFAVVVYGAFSVSQECRIIKASGEEIRIGALVGVVVADM